MVNCIESLKKIHAHKNCKICINTKKNVQPNANQNDHEFCCCLLTRPTFWQRLKWMLHAGEDVRKWVLPLSYCYGIQNWWDCKFFQKAIWIYLPNILMRISWDTAILHYKNIFWRNNHTSVQRSIHKDIYSITYNRMV